VVAVVAVVVVVSMADINGEVGTGHRMDVSRIMQCFTYQ
jgi:hypothetical protein